MASRNLSTTVILLVLMFVTALPAAAQSFRVQCPNSTITHPNAANNNSEPAYVGPTYTGLNGYPSTPAHVNGAIKCQQIGGGDGFATMGDGTQIYMFSVGPLSGLADIANGQPGTEFPKDFNQVYGGPFFPGDPATAVSAVPGPNTFPIAFTYNGAVGLTPDLDAKAAGLCGGSGQPSCLNGHVDPRPIIDVGVMNLRGHQHRRQLHLLLSRAGCRDVLLALPYYASRAPTDGHGRAALRAPAAESRGSRRQPLCRTTATGAG